MAARPSSHADKALTAKPEEQGEDVSLSLLLARIKRAADQDTADAWTEAQYCLSELARCPVTIMVNAAGSWFDFRQLKNPDLAIEHGPAADAGALPEPTGTSGEQLLTIRPGSIVARLRTPVIDVARSAQLDVMALAIDMALELYDGRQRLARNVSELDVLRTVATRILEITDLDDLLLLVSHETKRLLISDICGVMLREGNEVVMRSCVGYFAAETSRLRMEAGVGVAGQVLASGEPCIVSNYVESEIITHDFVPLARLEKVRSALAVPIISRNAIIGVLEVWRRQPSNFTDNDQRLLQSLAGLASIAIDNARLMQSRERAAAGLSKAHDELAKRYDAITQAAAFQREISRLFLNRDPLQAIAAKTADFTNGSIFLLHRDLTVEATKIFDEEVSARLMDALPRLLGSSTGLSEEPVTGIVEDIYVFALPISSGTEALGWVVWADRSEYSEVVRLSLGHVALSTAMHLLERRRIARERTETLEGLLWDLLEGSEPVRAAAIDRAREMRVPVHGRMRVILISLSSSSAGEGDESWQGQFREDIANRIRMSEIGRSAHIAGIRGDQARLLCRDGDRVSLSTSINILVKELRQAFPSLAPAAGISSVCDNVQLLPTGLREALVALEVARHRNQATVTFYDEIGVLGLLINLRDRVDMRRVSNQILGDIAIEPEQSRRTLLDTLAAYFASDCSQVDTASRLNVHQKTVAYRLVKISKLSGLNLARHQDRVLMDIATKLNVMLAADRDP